MKGLARPVEDQVRNAIEMRAFMQSMGLSDETIERAIKVKFNLPDPDPQPRPASAKAHSRRKVRRGNPRR
jgi:hypothetical protein